MGASGTGVIDFGAFPGSTDTSLVVTGQAGILSGSAVEAWIRPVDTADHTADEHLVEELQVMADPTTIVAGVGFTIRGVHRPSAVALRAGATGRGRGDVERSSMLWGQWGVFWVWN